MSAHHHRYPNPSQDTARMSMHHGQGASLWEQVPYVDQCRWPSPRATGHATEITDPALAAEVIRAAQHNTQQGAA